MAEFSDRARLIIALPVLQLIINAVSSLITVLARFEAYLQRVVARLCGEKGNLPGTHSRFWQGRMSVSWAEEPKVEQALRNSVILRKIFQNLSFPDLLIASLVNKSWRREARSVLREERRCLLSIYGEKPCVKLFTGITEIFQRATSPLPFNGLLIDFHLLDYHDCTDTSEKSAINFDFLLNNFKFKCLKLRGTSQKVKWRNECLLSKFVVQFILSNALNLEELDLEECPDWIMCSFADLGLREPLTFPALKELYMIPSHLQGTYRVLSYGLEDRWQFKRGDFVADLILNAPNLQKIGNTWNICDLVLMPTKAWPLIRELEVGVYDEEEFGETFRALEAAGGVPWKANLTKLTVQYIGAEALPLPCKTALISMVQTSGDCLIELSVPYCVLRMLTAWGIPPLNCVKRLEIQVHIDTLDGVILPSSSWTWMSSNLESLNISIPDDSPECSCQVEEHCEDLAVCETVREISIKTGEAVPVVESFRNFASGFPKVEEFEWHCDRAGSLPPFVVYIWDNWRDLKRLHLAIQWTVSRGEPHWLPRRPSSLQMHTMEKIQWTAAFTGLHFTEVGLLSQIENKGELWNLNYVAPYASILNLKELELLSVHLLDPQEPAEGDWCVFQSELVHMLAFSRMNKRFRLQIRH